MNAGFPVAERLQGGDATAAPRVQVVLFHIDAEGLLVVDLPELGVGVFPAENGVHCHIKDGGSIDYLKARKAGF